MTHNSVVAENVAVSYTNHWTKSQKNMNFSYCPFLEETGAH